MGSTRPTVVVLVGPEAGAPPGCDELTTRADVEVVRGLDEVVAALDRAGRPVALAVYDFRTDIVRRLGPRAAEFGWIHAASAGVDAVLTPAVVEGDTVVTNARGVFDRPIAEYVLGVLLAFCKDLPRTLALQGDGVWRHRETLPFAGRRVLVVGAGSIGSEVGRLVQAAGAEVRGLASAARDDPVFGSIRPASELHEHLGWADDVVCCLPLSDRTRRIFDDRAFAAVRDGATFVNVGRGAVVDEDALLAALRSGRLAAAALDVFDTEPLPPGHPFWEMEQVIVSPHMSGDEVGWEAELTRQLVANVDRWRAGEELQARVEGG